MNRLTKQLGDRIAGRRAVLSISQEQLSETLHITPAELDEFETGTIRMSALQVFDMAQALGVPIAFFFADPPKAPELDTGFHQYPELPDSARPRRSESSDLITIFRRIEDKAVRSCILDFVRSLVPREPAVTAFGQDNQPGPDLERESTFEGLARVARSVPVPQPSQP